MGVPPSLGQGHAAVLPRDRPQDAVSRSWVHQIPRRDLHVPRGLRRRRAGQVVRGARGLEAGRGGLVHFLLFPRADYWQWRPRPAGEPRGERLLLAEPQRRARRGPAELHRYCAQKPADQGLVQRPLPSVARLRGLDHVPGRQQPRVVRLRPDGLHDGSLVQRRAETLALHPGQRARLRDLHRRPLEGWRVTTRRDRDLRGRVRRGRRSVLDPRLRARPRGLRPRPLVPGLVPQEGDGCYIENPDGVINMPGSELDDLSDPNAVCWWHMKDGAVLGVHNGMIIEYDESTLAPLGMVVSRDELQGRRVAVVDNGYGGSTCLLYDDENNSEVTVVQPNEDGTYWRKVVRNKMYRTREKR